MKDNILDFLFVWIFGALITGMLISTAINTYIDNKYENLLLKKEYSEDTLKLFQEASGQKFKDIYNSPILISELNNFSQTHQVTPLMNSLRAEHDHEENKNLAYVAIGAGIGISAARR